MKKKDPSALMVEEQPQRPELHAEEGVGENEVEISGLIPHLKG